MHDVLFRVNCSAQVGFGHLIRCLALAKALRKKMMNISFIINNDAEQGKEIINQNHFRFFEIDNSLTVLDDAKTCVAIIKTLNAKIQWLIVDHYDIDHRWERAMSPYVKNMMVIDDLANRKHYCSLLLDQNLYQNPLNRYQQLVSGKTRLLLGPQYALLREEFLNITKKYNSETKRIIVFMGGGDQSDIVLKILTAIKITNSDAKIDVIISNHYSAAENIKIFCQHEKNIHYHAQTMEIAPLMAQADFAIGAGGSAIWERCILGLPSLVLSVTTHQIPIAKAVHDQGGLYYLGKADEVTISQIQSAICDLLKHKKKLKEMSIVAANLVDGLGCERVSEYLRGSTS